LCIALVLITGISVATRQPPLSICTEPPTQTVQNRKKSDAVESADERARRTSQKIKALSLLERQQFEAEYMAQGGKGNTYQPKIGTFKNALERTAYTAWLRAKMAASLD
jgi:hypothetical protein